jgi:hypothetical protein
LLSRFPEKWRTRVLPWRKPPWPRGFTARKIFIMLFLMLGPLNILVPFINLTGNSETGAASTTSNARHRVFHGGAGLGWPARAEHPRQFRDSVPVWL